MIDRVVSLSSVQYSASNSINYDTKYVRYRCNRKSIPTETWDLEMLWSYSNGGRS